MCNMLNQDDSGKLLTSNINLIGVFSLHKIQQTNKSHCCLFPPSQCVVFNCIYSLLSSFLRVRQSIEIKGIQFLLVNAVVRERGHKTCTRQIMNPRARHWDRKRIYL